MNLKANFAEAPKFSCAVPKNGIWIASDYDYGTDLYTNVFKTNCKVLRGISQLRIIVPNYTRAGTDGSIRYLKDGGYLTHFSLKSKL